MIEHILGARLRRQALSHPIERSSEYDQLFRLLQPVAPIYFSYPGTPPRLVHRTTFDDEELADARREDRRIVKGRFQKGRVGYVALVDLETYAIAFRKPLYVLNDVQERVLEIVQNSGPLSGDQIQEEAEGMGGSLLKKQIMPALHRMQQAFLVYEDQVETDWGRLWYEFKTEMDHVDLESRSWEEAAGEVVVTFLRGHVFGTVEQVADWSTFPKRYIVPLMKHLEASGRAFPVAVDGLGEGWVGTEPIGEEAPPPYTWMLHRTDPLSLSHASEMKRRYGDTEVLQYLLIDGELRGAVLGHWRIGPHNVDDVVVELPKRMKSERKLEILEAVKMVYGGPGHEIVKYDGKRL